MPELCQKTPPTPPKNPKPKHRKRIPHAERNPIKRPKAPAADHEPNGRTPGDQPSNQKSDEKLEGQKRGTAYPQMQNVLYTFESFDLALSLLVLEQHHFYHGFGFMLQPHSPRAAQKSLHLSGIIQNPGRQICLVEPIPLSLSNGQQACRERARKTHPFGAFQGSPPPNEIFDYYSKLLRNLQKH